MGVPSQTLQGRRNGSPRTQPCAPALTPRPGGTCHAVLCVPCTVTSSMGARSLPGVDSRRQGPHLFLLKWRAAPFPKPLLRKPFVGVLGEAGAHHGPERQVAPVATLVEPVRLGGVDDASCVADLQLVGAGGSNAGVVCPARRPARRGVLLLKAPSSASLHLCGSVMLLLGDCRRACFREGLCCHRRPRSSLGLTGLALLGSDLTRPSC